jgi:hypothetical protein
MSGCRLRLSQYLTLVDNVIGIPENSHRGNLGESLLKQPQRFSDDLSGHRGVSRYVGTRSRKTCNEPCSHRIANAYDNDRDSRGRILGCQRRLRYHRNNDVNIELDQLPRKLRETIKIPVRKSVLNDNVSSLDIAKLTQPASEFVVISQWPGCGRTR